MNFIMILLFSYSQWLTQYRFHFILASCSIWKQKNITISHQRKPLFCKGNSPTDLLASSAPAPRRKKRSSPTGWKKTADPPSSSFATNVWAPQTSRPRPVFCRLRLSSLEVEQGRTAAAGGCEALAEALKVNSAIIRIDLWRNQIGDAGVKAICFLKFLWQKTRKLFAFWVSDCFFLQAFAEMLKVNTTLKVLYLKGNQIGDIGVEAQSLLPRKAISDF